MSLTDSRDCFVEFRGQFWQEFRQGLGRHGLARIIDSLSWKWSLGYQSPKVPCPALTSIVSPTIYFGMVLLDIFSSL